MDDHKDDHKATVSFDDEPLILVDEQDREVGHLAKGACHDGEGVLHRAFSVFLFNDSGELLLHRRSAEKRLWPMFWTNSCCSHPRRGESLQSAARRRVREELGMEASPKPLFSFVYHARFGDLGSEHELCTVLGARSSDLVRVNPHEVAEWRFIAPEKLDAELDASPEQYTPWLKLEWPRLRQEHWPQVLQICAS